MSAGKLCTRTVITVKPRESVRSAARLMLKRNVGSLVVTDPEKWPVGILTDRDIVTRGVANGRDLDELRVDDIMSSPVRTIAGTTTAREALEIMRRIAVRRLVVTRDDGLLAGLLSLDDIIELIASETGAIAALIRKETPTVRA